LDAADHIYRLIGHRLKKHIAEHFDGAERIHNFVGDAGVGPGKTHISQAFFLQLLESSHVLQMNHLARLLFEVDVLLPDLHASVSSFIVVELLCSVQILHLALDCHFVVLSYCYLLKLLAYAFQAETLASEIIKLENLAVQRIQLLLICVTGVEHKVSTCSVGVVLVFLFDVKHLLGTLICEQTLLLVVQNHDTPWDDVQDFEHLLLLQIGVPLKAKQFSLGAHKEMEGDLGGRRVDQRKEVHLHQAVGHTCHQEEYSS